MKLKKKSKLDIALKSLELPEGEIEEVELKVNYKNGTFKATATYENNSKQIIEGKGKNAFLRTTITNSEYESDEDVEDKVLYLYENKSMTQEAIEEYTGVSQATISRILRKNGYHRGKKKDLGYGVSYIIDEDR